MNRPTASSTGHELSGLPRAQVTRPDRDHNRLTVRPRGQLSFVSTPRVLMRYHPDEQPSAATGPFEYGAFVASLACRPDLFGEGEDEQSAVRALAGVLRELAEDIRSRPRLTVLGQVLTAAERLSEEDFVQYLLERAGEPVLA